MVFSSFPVYLDHPNLHQFQQQQADRHHQQGAGGIDTSQLPPAQLPPVGGSTGSIRPGSMVDRARQARLPLPEAGLKCPRCDSTNTKFCYFNNYNLSQPRHFCKTCRRYWTRGGALRNVPVGGGCRRNKKSKGSSSSSKGGASSDRGGQIVGQGLKHRTGIEDSYPINPNTSTASPSSSSMDLVGHFPHQPSLMAALHNLNRYGGGGVPPGHMGFQAQMVAAAASGSNNNNNIGLSNMGFNLVGNGNNNDLSGAAPEQWRLPPSIGGGFEAPNNLFTFHGGEGGVEDNSSNSMMAGGVSQQVTSSSVKSEETPVGLNLTKQFFVNSDTNQFWSGSPWTGSFSGLNSSNSTTHHLL